jgi:hypothetical protein
VIQVTELEVFRPASEGEQRSTGQQLNLNTRLRLLDSPSLFYDLNYFVNSVSGSERRTFMVNGVSLSHAFDPVWSVAARAANERSDEASRRRVADVLSASLSAVPLPTLRSSVLVGGRREQVDGRQVDSANTLVSAFATIYRGVDLNASVGASTQTESGGRSIRTRLANISAELRPNRIFALYITYDDSSREISSEGQPTVKDPNAAFELGANLNPLPTLYLFGSRRSENRSATGRRTLHNLSLSWSPFPRGTLRFSFFYNEYHESDLDTLVRSGGPSVRWNLNRRTYLNMGYERLRSESDQQDLDRDVLYGTLRVGF